MNIKPDIVIAGAGTMGSSMAKLFAISGYNTILWNHREASLERARDNIFSQLKQAEQNSELEAAAEEVIGRLSFSTSWEVFENADIIIENIKEDSVIKQGFYQRICEICSSEAIIATNTSGIPINSLSAGITLPERFCGMHWWNPADLIPLIEVTRGEKTSENTIQTIYDLALSLGKEPIRVNRDIPGIIGNRLQLAVLREAVHIIQSGAASPEDVDKAMKYGPGLRYALMGPLETADLGGIDVFNAIAGYLFEDLGNESECEFLQSLVNQGKLGTKAGEGIYKYTPEDIARKINWRDLLLKKQWNLIQSSKY